MKVDLKFHGLVTCYWDAGNSFSNPASSTLLRRSRLKLDGFAYSTKLKYKVGLGLSNRNQFAASKYRSDGPRYILDAVLKWNFSENFALWFGQTKLLRIRQRIISSSNLQQIESSLWNSRFTIDRDIGLQLRHHFNLTDTFLVKEIFSLTRNEDSNFTTRNIGVHPYTTKVELLTFENFTSKGIIKMVIKSLNKNKS
jgi:hypothetical protein